MYSSKSVCEGGIWLARFYGCVRKCIVCLFCKRDDCTVYLHLNLQCRNMCHFYEEEKWGGPSLMEKVRKRGVCVYDDSGVWKWELVCLEKDRQTSEGKTDEHARHKAQKTQWGKTQTSSFLLNKEFCPSQKISLDTKEVGVSKRT